MSVSLDFPWEQYALITELAARMQGRGRLGKTALQKLVYLLQELHGVRTGYEFTLHTYGPFSAGLTYDADLVDAMGGIRATYDPQINGYDIAPGPKAEWMRGRAAEFLEASAHALEEVVAEFGRFGARELELRATIVYADRELRQRQPPTGDALVGRVAEIKPHFSRGEIAAVVESMARKGYVLAG